MIDHRPGLSLLPSLVLALAVTVPLAAQDATSAAPDGGPTDRLEARLSAAPFTLPFEITAEGVLTVDLDGTLQVGRDGVARLEARGDWDGQRVDLLLVSDGREMIATAGERRERAPAPPALADALVVGLTRMGVLHNIARLTAAAFPDHDDGGVRDWVVVHAPDGSAAPGGRIDMDITVAGRPAGTATLELNPDGSPRLRTQVVQFPQGEMRVTERYGELSRG